MVYTNRYLAHHGIKGQKWGIRRYENPDGTLTEAGKERYNKQQTKQRNKEYDKNRTTMSDKDLDGAINRLKKENELHRLTNPGKSFVNAIMSDVGKKVLTVALTGAALYAGKHLISKFLASKKNQDLTTEEIEKNIDRLKKLRELNKLETGFDVEELANAVFNGGAKKK